MGKGMQCRGPACNGTLIGPLRVKVSEVHIPSLLDVNTLYWKYSIEDHTLEGLGYVCPRCGKSQMIKLPRTDIVERMLA